ncbi:MAG: hypothetical protein AB2A00_42695, partial [Myxococcota bacterium]
WWARVGRKQWPVVVAVGLLCVVVAALWLSGFKRTFYSMWDDHNGYLPLSIQLLQRGDLIHPFSIRRMHAYGGQTYLDALALLRFDVMQLHGVDMGLALAWVALLLVGSWRYWRPRRRWLLPVALAFVLVIQHTRPNLSSLMTGVVALLGLLRTLQWLWPRHLAGPRAALLLALVVTQAALLRVSYVPAAGLMVLLAYLSRRRVRELLMLGGVCTVLLVPWAISLWQSSGTPLFPVFKGHLTSRTNNFDLYRFGSALWDWYLLVFRSDQTISVYAKLSLLLAAPLVLRTRPRLRPEHLAWMACLATYLFSIARYHHSDQGHMDRYNMPFVCVASLAVLLAVARSRSSLSTRVALALALVAGAAQLSKSGTNLKYIQEALAFLPKRCAAGPTRAEPLYARLQAAVPAGAPVVAMVEYPWMLDAARNKVLFLDSLGFAAPPPGIPFDDGPDAIRAYFRGLGLRYMVAVDPESARWRSSFYGVATWEQAIRSGQEHIRHDVELQLQAAHVMKKLIDTSTVLERVNDVAVLDFGE